jgi:hypothetical protein
LKELNDWSSNPVEGENTNITINILTFVYLKKNTNIMLCLLCVVGIDWVEYKRQLKKSEQWNVEVY